MPRTSQGHSRGSKTSGRPSKPWKNKHSGVDIHDPNSRMSMTPGGATKLRASKLRADPSFPMYQPHQSKNYKTPFEKPLTCCRNTWFALRGQLWVCLCSLVLLRAGYRPAHAHHSTCAAQPEQTSARCGCCTTTFYATPMLGGCWSLSSSAPALYFDDSCRQGSALPALEV